MFGVCRPACHDSSLYRIVLVLFMEAVVLSQVFVAFNIFNQHIVHVYWGVVYGDNFAIFIIRSSRLLSSDSSCSIFCSFYGVSVDKNMSSVKRRWVRNSVFIFTPLFSQINLLSRLSNFAVNSLGVMMTPHLTPLSILIFSLYLYNCRLFVTEMSADPYSVHRGISFAISWYT